jgi:hypothetical protein
LRNHRALRSNTTHFFMKACGTTVDRGTNGVPHPPDIVACQPAVKKPILNASFASLW